MSTLLWVFAGVFIRAAHRSPPAHRDAGSAPKAQRDWRNMKYLTQPVLAVTYWGRAGCLSMPEIDLMLRASRADGRSTLSSWETVRSTGVSSAFVLSQAVCELPSIPQTHQAQVSSCVFRCVCVCVCTVITAVFSKHLWDQSVSVQLTRSRSSGRSHTIIQRFFIRSLRECELWTLTVCWEVKGHSLNIFSSL